MSESHGLILAIDTATTRVIVALGTGDGAVVDGAEWPAGYRHGETLMPAIDSLLGGSASAHTQLEAIVVGTGPGAFTGLRVGIATAKGLAVGLGLPLIGISTAGAILMAAPARSVLLLPAGPADRLLVRPDDRARLLPAGTEPDLDDDETLLAVDLAGPGAGRRDRPGRGGTALARSVDARARGGATRARRSRGPGRTRARLHHAAPGRSRGWRGGGMVARPPMILRIEPMSVDDLPAVHAIEAASFDAPWPPEAYRNDLETNRLAQYLVARIGDEVAAFGGMWLMVDEGHIITFAVHPAWRRQNVGGRLLLSFLDLAHQRGAHEATLEVRLSNLPARRLYEKYGFRPVGLRPRYYSDNGEDALIMTTEPLADPVMRDRLARLRAAIDAAPDPTRRGVP